MKPDGHLESHTVIDMRSVMRTKPYVNLGNSSVEFFVKIRSTGCDAVGKSFTQKALWYLSLS